MTGTRAQPERIEGPRIEVLRGFSEETARALDRVGVIVVGSSSLCGLRVLARGVRARHVLFAWDGRRLSVANGSEPGSVLLDGAALEDPREIAGSAVVEFGEAALRVVTGSDPADDSPTLRLLGPSAPDPALFRRRSTALAALCVVAFSIGALLARAVTAHDTDVHHVPERTR